MNERTSRSPESLRESRSCGVGDDGLGGGEPGAGLGAAWTRALLKARIRACLNLSIAPCSLSSRLRLPDSEGLACAADSLLGGDAAESSGGAAS